MFDFMLQLGNMLNQLPMILLNLLSKISLVDELSATVFCYNLKLILHLFHFSNENFFVPKPFFKYFVFLLLSLKFKFQRDSILLPISWLIE